MSKHDEWDEIFIFDLDRAPPVTGTPAMVPTERGARLDFIEARIREFKGCEDPSHLDQNGVVTKRPSTEDQLWLVAEARRALAEVKALQLVIAKLEQPSTKDES